MDEGTAAVERREKLRRLESEPLDLLVVGGGINGAGIAREAAQRGLSVAVVDKGDFAVGTSSRSSKLIHGGIRYLEHGHLGLVLEASRERDLLRRRLAPHLVRPLAFFYPVWRETPVGLWKLRAGLLLYDLLAAFRNIHRHRVFRGERALALEPNLRREGLRGGALYYDCITDDARLVLETLLGAEADGAVCLNYVSVAGFEKENGRITGVKLHDLDSGHRFTARAAAFVNATGPWLDHLRRLDDPASEPVLRPTKGVHLVVSRDRIGNQNAVVLHGARDGRVLFVLPWDGHSLVGTTDTDFEGDPDRVEADDRDVRYLLDTVNHWFPQARLTPADVVSTFAGLRPLIGARPGLAPSAVSREEEIFESPSGLVSIGGGKLTTYRRVAIKVVDAVAKRLVQAGDRRVRRSSRTAYEPLPGALGSLPTIEGGDESAAFLTERYGTRAREILERIRQEPALARRLAADGHIEAEAWFAAAREMALRVDDVLRRRTQIALHARDGGASVADRVAQRMAGPLGRNSRTAEPRAAGSDAAAEESPRRREA